MSRYFVICCLIYITVVLTSNVGKVCYHRHKKMKGICQRPANCEVIYNDLRNEIFPQKCGRKPTVCCTDNKTGEKSREMCKKYENLTYVWEQEPTLLVGNKWHKRNICPWESHGTTVIYGGEKSKLGEFPHMALIGYGMKGPKWRCGGSLISENFVITAAHCTYSRLYGNATIVRLGDLNFTNPDDDIYVQDITIKEIYIHPDYRGPSSYNDIALFELEYPVKLSIYVKPICIYTKERLLIKEVLATGWGNTEEKHNGENDYLLKVTLDMYSKTICSNLFKSRIRGRKSVFLPKGLMSDIQICVGSSGSKKDTCQGDSGGPIQIYAADTACSYYILGITSFGKQCGGKEPSVYVRIYPYITWIESIVWP